jgi:predicted PurR-regulated permease PerM
LAALLELVPVVGPVILGALIFLVGISVSLRLGIYGLIFAFVAQQFESNVLVPLVMGRTLKLHPVLVIVSLLAGAEVAGFIGIILAVPIAVVLQEVLVHLEDRKKTRSSLNI